MKTRFVSKFDNKQVNNVTVAEHCRLNKIRRTGSRHIACCPFHSDSTPSFAIYENGFHCFGCGWHGDAIKMLMELKSYTYQQAVEFLRTC